MLVGKFSLNTKFIGILSVVQCRICPDVTFGLMTILLRFLLLLVIHFVPTKVIRVRNKDKPWFDDQFRHDFGLKQEAHLQWTRDRSRVNWEEFVRCQVRANEAYSEAKRQFRDRNRDAIMNA